MRRRSGLCACCAPHFDVGTLAPKLEWIRGGPVLPVLSDLTRLAVITIILPPIPSHPVEFVFVQGDAGL